MKVVFTTNIIVIANIIITITHHMCSYDPLYLIFSVRRIKTKRTASMVNTIYGPPVLEVQDCVQRRICRVVILTFVLYFTSGYFVGLLTLITRDSLHEMGVTHFRFPVST